MDIALTAAVNFLPLTGCAAGHVDQRDLFARNAEALAERRMVVLVGEKLDLRRRRERSEEIRERTDRIWIDAGALHPHAIVGARLAQAGELTLQPCELKPFKLFARQRQELHNV